MGEYDRTGNGQSSKTDWDLRSILCDIAKNWWVILLIACSAAMITYTVMATVHKDRYTVKTTFAVMGRGVDANAASSLSATYEMAQKFEAILENTILKKKVMEELSLSSFPAKMNASIVPESNLMELSVTADSPEMAFRILKSVLNNYTSISDYIIPNVVLETLQQPQVSGVPSNQIPTKKYAATAFLAAALAMAALIGLFSFLRDTVKNEAEFTRKIDADLLGVVYHEKKKKNSSMLITNPARSFLYVESLKRIASRVRGRLDRKGGKVLLVTSVAENEGKSTLAANLALALAEEQNRVLLLDCDFRQPALHKIFEIPEKDGKDFGKVVLGKESASGVFEKHKDMDYIILDTPPMGMTADAEELAEYADAAVLSVRQDGVLTRDINDAIDALNQKEEKVIGCVFGNVYPGFGERIGNSYGYGYGYGTYSRAER